MTDFGKELLDPLVTPELASQKVDVPDIVTLILDLDEHHFRMVNEAADDVGD
jgi:hypothetical protein